MCAAGRGGGPDAIQVPSPGAEALKPLDCRSAGAGGPAPENQLMTTETDGDQPVPSLIGKSRMSRKLFELFWQLPEP